MSLKSSWAFNNGKRMMKDIINSQKSELYGFVNNKYAERGKHNPNELYVKTYANKTQCLKKIEILKELGFDCFMSNNYPFVIIKK